MNADRAVAEVRRAVRDALRGHRGVPVVACSGGADSLALLAATVAEAPGGVHAVVVDHGLQEGSADVAARVVDLARGLGARALAVRVDVDGRGGLEAAARRARYAALRAARTDPESPVLLGHTLDDQAETVLLGLGRGSGARSLAGMREWDPPWLRPLLGVRRATTRAACAALDLPVWEDPHNADSRYTRVRLRREVMPLLEDVLAGGVGAALARTARQLREDVDALDALAADLRRRAEAGATQFGLTECATRADGMRNSPQRNAQLAATECATRADGMRNSRGAPDVGRPVPGVGRPVPGVGQPGPGLDAAVLAGAPPAVRRRALRSWLHAQGVTGLTDGHLRAAERVAVAPGRAGTGAAVALPGGLELVRRRGTLLLRTAAWSPTTRPLPPSSKPTEERPVYDGDIASVLVTEEAIRTRTAELAQEVGRDYAERVESSDLLLVGVLKGAVMFMTDLARALPMPVQLEFMAVSSYGSSTSSSGVVRILKDLDRDIAGRHVLIVEDIIDSGLTLSWLLKNLESRAPASLQVCTLLRKPDAITVDVPVAYVGFDIPNEFVVGYGLDYAERYRDLPYIGTLDPAVYA